MRPTEDDLFRDSREDDMRERDHHREPHRHPRCIVVPPVDAVLDTTIITLPCPSCKAEVYVPGDSNLERVDCHDCEAVLVTRRDLDGLSLVHMESP